MDGSIFRDYFHIESHGSLVKVTADISQSTSVRYRYEMKPLRKFAYPLPVLPKGHHAFKNSLLSTSQLHHLVGSDFTCANQGPVQMSLFFQVGLV
jgi:hypothetical protein